MSDNDDVLYQSIREFKEALEGCNITPDDILTINKDGILYVYKMKGDNTPIFIGDYENNQACEDICVVLGIDSPTIHE
jgi:hypothetical protein